MNLLLLLLACPAPVSPLPAVEAGLAGGSSVLVDDGGLRRRLAPRDDADLVLFTGGEQRGRLGPCGCPRVPRGSLARVESYVEATRRRDDTPSILLNAGAFLMAGSDVVADVTNRAMVDGLAASGWDVLNVTPTDLAGLQRLGLRPEGAVSANLGVDGWPPAVRTFATRAGTVAVTGVSGGDPASADPVEAVRSLEVDADVLVVLAWHVGERAEELLRLPGVDVLVEADGFLERYPLWREGDTLWVRTHLQTRRLGELRLRVRDGQIAGALDRRIDLDDRIPDGRDSRRVADRATAELVEVLSP